MKTKTENKDARISFKAILEAIDLLQFHMVGSELDHDVIELKKFLGISYEQACSWILKRLDRWELAECQKALREKKESLRTSKRELQSLQAICEHYELAA